LLDILFSILRKNHDEVTAEDHVTYETTAEQAALLWQKLNYTPSFIISQEAPRLLKLWRDDGGYHLEQPPKWTRFTDGSAASGAKRAMAISRLEKMAKSVLRERIASVKAERTREVHEHFDVARKIERKKMKIERRAENLDEEVARRRTGLLVDMTTKKAVWTTHRIAYVIHSYSSLYESVCIVSTS
jgi:hypothetical protein